MFKSRSGFTIVELLIVIVVIAILAAISIVAYNGIQQRAKFAQQVAEVDKVGKAIQLWSAENGKSIGESGHGYQGQGFGGFQGDTGVYPPPSLENMLRESGYLVGPLTVNSNYMLAPCTTLTNTRWVVLAIVSPAPPTSVTSQISQLGCTNGLINLYAGITDGTYNRNFVKAY